MRNTSNINHTNYRYHYSVRFVGVVLSLLLFSAVGVVSCSAAETTIDTVGLPLQADQQLLSDYALRFWQKINQARRNPLATASRLGIDESTLRGVFGNSQHILDQGLPPLAWSSQLQQSSGTHGADMLARNFYSYYTPENTDPYQRIVASGYRPALTGETINALFFNSFVDFERAADKLLDSTLRDELDGTRTSRYIFNPEITEIGVSFFAQTADLQPELPYVYMLVADFAAPIIPRRFVVIESGSGDRVAMKKFRVTGWTYPASLRPGLYQVPEPEGGALLVAISDAGLGQLGHPKYLTTSALSRITGNVYLDLSF